MARAGGRFSGERRAVTWKTSLIIVAAVAVGGAALMSWRWASIKHEGHDALWHVVHDLCAPDEATNKLPAPCVAVDLDKGYAVLKDQSGVSQVLVIPTARVSGIESPDVLGPSAPNYWQDAWQARGFVERFAHHSIPRDDIALAVNSVYGRSQNQLHIHVDCVRPDVERILVASLSRIGPAWSDFEVPLAGRRYRAMWLPGADLAGRNPFDLLAKDPTARADMGRETLAVVPVTSASGARGFVLLSDRANPAEGDKGHGEAVQDHHCRVLESAL
jgi:CDP-diacylglycerol pyrophosphatase